MKIKNTVQNKQNRRVNGHWGKGTYNSTSISPTPQISDEPSVACIDPLGNPATAPAQAPATPAFSILLWLKSCCEFKNKNSLNFHYPIHSQETTSLPNCILPMGKPLLQPLPMAVHHKQ
jgi:hypothetical protein